MRGAGGEGSAGQGRRGARSRPCLGRAVEAPVSVLEADVVSQLVAVGVELADFPLGLQGVRVGGWGSGAPREGHQPPGAAPTTPGLPTRPQARSGATGPQTTLTPARGPGSAGASSPPRCPPAWPRRLWGTEAGVRGLEACGVTRTPPTGPASYLLLCGTLHRWASHLQGRGSGSALLVPAPTPRTEPIGAGRLGEPQVGEGRPGPGGPLTGRARQAERSQGQQGEGRHGPHGGSVLSASVSGCGAAGPQLVCLSPRPAPAPLILLVEPRRRGGRPPCCGRVPGDCARAVWESSAPALKAKPQRMLWLELELPGQARPLPRGRTPSPPAPASV